MEGTLVEQAQTNDAGLESGASALVLGEPRTLAKRDPASVPRISLVIDRKSVV